MSFKRWDGFADDLLLHALENDTDLAIIIVAYAAENDVTYAEPEARLGIVSSNMLALAEVTAAAEPAAVSTAGNDWQTG